MDVSIQHGDRAKALEVAECLGSVIGAPPPLGVDTPERHVREHNDRRAAREMFHVALDPIQLLGAKEAKTASLQIQNVHESNEMNAAVVEAVPASALTPLLSAFAVALKVARTAIYAYIVLSRNVEGFAGTS